MLVLRADLGDESACGALPGIANYTALLEKMGCTDEQVKQRLKEIVEAE